MQYKSEFEQNKRNTSSHLSLTDRTTLEITGVDEITSYDDRTIELVVCGVKTVIEGETLKVTKLSVGDGTVCAVGNFTAITYDEGKSVKKGFFSSVLGK